MFQCGVKLLLSVLLIYLKISASVYPIAKSKIRVTWNSYCMSYLSYFQKLEVWSKVYWCVCLELIMYLCKGCEHCNFAECHLCSTALLQLLTMYVSTSESWYSKMLWCFENGVRGSLKWHKYISTQLLLEALSHTDKFALRCWGFVRFASEICGAIAIKWKEDGV